MTDSQTRPVPYLKPHAYSPSAMHMGDCSTCGYPEQNSIHATDSQVRAMTAERDRLVKTNERLVTELEEMAEVAMADWKAGKARMASWTVNKAQAAVDEAHDSARDRDETDAA